MLIFKHIYLFLLNINNNHTKISFHFYFFLISSNSIKHSFKILQRKSTLSLLKTKGGLILSMLSWTPSELINTPFSLHLELTNLAKSPWKSLVVLSLTQSIP